MKEREREILQTISKAYPQMTEFQRGYLLGVAESRKEEKQKAEDAKRDLVAV